MRGSIVLVTMLLGCGATTDRDGDASSADTSADTSVETASADTSVDTTITDTVPIDGADTLDDADTAPLACPVTPGTVVGPPECRVTASTIECPAGTYGVYCEYTPPAHPMVPSGLGCYGTSCCGTGRDLWCCPCAH
jgi:hypothetical protein